MNEKEWDFRSAVSRNIYPVPEFRYAFDLAEELLAGFHVNGYVIFGNATTSKCKVRNGKSTIMFSYKSVRAAMTHGFLEYKSLQYLIGGERTKPGLEGVHQLVLHEVAHALQWATPGSFTKGSIHNQAFIGFYKELMMTIPWRST